MLQELYLKLARCLEYVRQEVMSPVVPLSSWIVIIPFAVVNWDLHLSRVSLVEAIAAAIILVAIEILWIIDIRVVIESLIVAIAGSTTPCFAICLRLRLSLLGLGVVIRCQTSDEC